MKMCFKVVYILCLFFIGSLVHAYINNEEPASTYKQKASYLNYHKLIHNHNINNNNHNNNNNRNSYQYFSHRLRHNNRFVNVDLKTENPFKKLYATTEKTIAEVYGESDAKPDDTVKHYEAEDEDEDADADDDEDDDEEDYNASEAEDWQAEEATEQPPTEKTLTEYKWKHFGTRSRVEESRKNQGITSTLTGEVHQAVAHARKVVQQGACHTPRIRLIKIQNVYPDAGKAYIPHCTLLHRCSDETGCCRTDSLTCAPKTTERIELYFYAGRPGSYKVEKLAFYNHTECHCVEKSQEVMSGDDAAQDEDRYPLRPPPDKQPQPIAEPLKRCHCPELYTPQVSHKSCRCDCPEGSRDCMRIKRGKEYFSLKDRLCIQRQECGNPACEFGVYMRFSGRCPRKQESLTKIPAQ